METPLEQLRRKRREEDDQSSWQLTFADMMTLILCFFVLLISISSVDAERYDQVADSLGAAMTAEKDAPRKESPEVGPAPEFVPPVKTETPAGRTFSDIMTDLRTRLAHEADAVQLEARPDAVAINLRGPVFFELGSAELTPRARPLLHSIAGSLYNTDYDLTVEGHTDDLPIRTAAYPSNWELSAARASRVVRYLQELGFAPGRMRAVGLADTRPLLPNKGVDGKPLPRNQVKNRRVVILVEAAD